MTIAFTAHACGLARALLTRRGESGPGMRRGTPTDQTARGRPERWRVVMDFWYERVIRELIDVNEEASALRRLAEQVSGPPGAEDADDDEEQHGGTDHQPDRSLG